MPGIIRILDEKSISQIAAGEVVEGPYSALKELIENSLDAGASSVSVAVEAGGTMLIRVSDDGLGMSSEDLSLAFQRHSTSKIASSADLSNIMTLGFRGEALASIASVARVEAVSRAHNSPEGNRIVIEGGSEKAFSPAGCPIGTTVSIRDLFHNTPARRKFLKSIDWEGNKCLSVFRALSLSRSDVEWKYYQDDRLRFHCPPADLRERIADLIGGQSLEGLEEVDFSEGGFKISGFISDISHTRGNREHQYLFLNRRRIMDYSLAGRINGIFERKEKSRDYPIYFLFLEIEPAEFDVNVHPAKTEVRFRRAKQVSSFVQRAVARALGTGAVYDIAPQAVWTKAPQSAHLEQRRRITPEEYGSMFDIPEAGGGLSDVRGKIPASMESEGRRSESFVPREMFQLHGKYIVTQVKEGMTLIDQHAAHERVLYEASLRNILEKKGSPQKLLFPSLMELAPNEAEALEELLPHLEMMGFIVKPFGPRSYLVESAPSGVKISDEVGLIRKMVEYYRENSEKLADRAEAAAAAFACHAAIKTGDELSPEEMLGLIEALFRTGSPFVCPHGRPTYIKIDMDELDRRFGRKR